jgi:hypothetical protein
MKCQIYFVQEYMENYIPNYLENTMGDKLEGG